MRYKLSLLLTEQPEGGFTITCRELPELITECDSLDEMMDNVIDAFHAVAGLYEHEQTSHYLQIFKSLMMAAMKMSKTNTY